MMPYGALAAAALVVGAAGGATSASAIDRSVTLVGPVEEPLHSLTPSFVINTAGFSLADRPVTLRLELSRSPQFDQLVADTTVTAEAATIVLQTLLPENATVYWRAVASTVTHDSVRSAVSGPHTVPAWLTLVSPANPRGTTFDSRRPTFTWSSAPVANPPGPWRYDFEIATAVGGRVQVRRTALTDTVFTPTSDLEANTSFRWSVTARLARGDSIRRASAATFLILEPGRPLATLLLQNFPNPFPTADAASTCIWFDLRDDASVRLEVFDLRGNLVRTLVPSAQVNAQLTAGRYGRGSVSPSGEGSGCDPRFSWNGVAADGRKAPPGVYMLRLAAGGAVFIRKMLLQSR
ncbi:MAG: hypothetical protein M3081_13930 [Gemmatimonadota bacterium]|nr:hypothetical protein [Gemmatimonadota bacterium]